MIDSIALATLVAVLLTATTSDAVLTTPKCLAGKARAAAAFRKCRLDAEAKVLEGKEPNPMSDANYAMAVRGGW